VHRYSATIRGYAGEGYGGPESGFHTRVDTLQFSTLAVRRSVAVLLDDTQGSGAYHFAGNVGLRTLKHFTLLFDCPTGRLYLQPSAGYNKPDIFNRAGLIVDPDPEQARIRMVLPNSPAADAGLKTGDIITRIDGAPPTDASLASAFERPPGNSHEFDHSSFGGHADRILSSKRRALASGPASFSASRIQIIDRLAFVELRLVITGLPAHRAASGVF
jgi:hypothetical protein